MKNKIIKVFSVIGTIILILVVLVYLTTYHPAKIEKQKIYCTQNAPVIKKESTLKILSWNVQYFAGKNYFFWYDSIHNDGPDKRPKHEDVVLTLNKAASIINDENPDLILLQEVDDGASRTDYEDQLQKLMELLSKDYVCHTSCFYWKALFVPHPKIMGKVGAKLSIISKYKIDSSVRIGLPINPGFVAAFFNYKRAVLKITMPVDDGNNLTIMNTHLEAFSKGTDLLKKQIDTVDKMLNELNGKEWILGGDFNLLPPGEFKNINILFRQFYNENSEIKLLMDKYKSFPALSDFTKDNKSDYFTFNSNNPISKAPDRTIDYFFYSDKLELKDKKIHQKDTLKISDHFPVIVNIKLK